jgi:hypothetical protein
MNGMRLSTFKGLDLPRFDGLVANFTKLDSMVFNSAKLDSITANFTNLDARVLAGGTCKPFFPSYETEVKAFRRASSSLQQGQRTWLAKGLRDWSSYVSDALARTAVEVKRRPDYDIFDLRTFLYRRQVRGLQRRALWTGRTKGAAVRAWLLNLHDVLLSRVAAGLRTSVPKVLLAILKAPPGWTTAARFRVVLESSIPKVLEQLAEVIAPNAPSRLDPPKHFRIEAGAV